ncbi:MAG: glutamate synthase subunit alpha, partial [Actinomycetes bacterium]
MTSACPAPQGLYDPANEHDACGVAFVVDVAGRASHDIVSQGLTALRNLEHRGASGSEPDTGDGAGILTQVPDALLRAVLADDGVVLPPAGHYAVGTAFLPTDDAEAAAVRTRIEAIAREEGLRALGWRVLPTDPEGAGVGATARSVMPRFEQLLLAAAEDSMTPYALERRAYVTRKRAEHETGTYFASLSSRTLVHKGMLTTGQLEPFFPDLSDERFASALALVHSRFSTNTFPSWPLAHPYRYIAHNGEINTVKGNRNWMRAREALLRGPHELPDDLSRLFPICTPGASDSASFDEVLELLHMAGRSLPHAVLMMVPEAWENAPDMDPAKRAFYEFHASVMEPWDGPACVTFTDGTLIGAVLDRNGLRPSRWYETADGRVILASEVGVLVVEPSLVGREGRVPPGQRFLGVPAT